MATRPSCFPSALTSWNKPRLYIGLYVRGGSPKMPGKEDAYHWALLSGPKKDPESGYRHVMYHAKEKLIIEGDPKVARSVWEYSAENGRAAMLLVRIVVGKVMDIHRLEKILRSVPLRDDKEGWNCLSFVREALHLAGLDQGALGSRVEDWERVQETAMWYVEQKKAAHRFDGLGSFDVSKPATWDMFQDRELIP